MATTRKSSRENSVLSEDEGRRALDRDAGSIVGVVALRDRVQWVDYDVHGHVLAGEGWNRGGVGRRLAWANRGGKGETGEWLATARRIADIKGIANVRG